MPLNVEFGVAKVNKYASRESGDTVEIVERPGGGLSAVLIDGQGSGPGAKALSLMLSARVVAMLKDGIRDGAVARAAHDVLAMSRSGKVSASLEIVSVDLRHRSILLTRNAETPAVIVSGAGARIVLSEQGPIGTGAFTRPGVCRFPFEEGFNLWVMSDGVSQAGIRSGGQALDLLTRCTAITNELLPADIAARRLLDTAIAADRGRPADDMSVVTLCVSNGDSVDAPRNMRVAMTVP